MAGYLAWTIVTRRALPTEAAVRVIIIHRRKLIHASRNRYLIARDERSSFKILRAITPRDSHHATRFSPAESSLNLER